MLVDLRCGMFGRFGVVEGYTTVGFWGLIFVLSYQESAVS